MFYLKLLKTFRRTEYHNQFIYFHSLSAISVRLEQVFVTRMAIFPTKTSKSSPNWICIQFVFTHESSALSPALFPTRRFGWQQRAPVASGMHVRASERETERAQRPFEVRDLLPLPKCLRPLPPRGALINPGATELYRLTYLRADDGLSARLLHFQLHFLLVHGRSIVRHCRYAYAYASRAERTRAVQTMTASFGKTVRCRLF